MRKEFQEHFLQQTQYVYEPVKWAYEMLRFDPDKWQADALNELVEKRFCAWSTGTGVGKSCNLSIATLWFLNTRPFPRVASTAPSQHQLYDVLWAEHAKWLRRNEMISKMFKWTQTRIGLRGHEEEWFAVARTSRPKPGDAHAEGLQGFHEDNLLFVVDEGCYDDQTDVLTRAGWKRFKDVTKDDLVLTGNPATGKAFYAKPTVYHEYDHDGPMYLGVHRTVNFCVTPNHNMIAGVRVQHKKGEPKELVWRTQTMQSLMSKDSFSIRKHFTLADKRADVEHFELPGVADQGSGVRPAVKIPMGPWLQFLGWYLSEGNVTYTDKKPYSVCITQIKDNINRAFIALACKMCGFEPKTYERSINVNNRQLAEYCATLGDNVLNKKIPRFVFDLSTTQILQFLDTFHLGDGSINKGTRVFYTSSEALADGIQELLLLSGRCASITDRPTEAPKWYKDHYIQSKATAYVVREYLTTDDAYIRKQRTIKKVDYKGKVYCLTVAPTHALFVRREGRSMWCGNSAVDDAIYSAMDGAFTTPDVYGVIASNPTRRRGYFYRQISDPANSAYHVITVDARYCKNVTKESIENVIKKYGEDSDFFRVKVLGLPPKADTASLIPDENVIAAHALVIEPDDSDLTVVSCDPARFGNDYTVIFARKGSKVLDRMQAKSMDTMAVADMCEDMIDRHNAKRILVDTIGIGSGVADRVRQKESKKGNGARVIDVNVSERAEEPEKFANRRAEMFWHLRTRISSISIPFETPLLDEELPLIDYSAEKKIQLASKESIKDEIQRATGVARSPNDADALALLFYNEVVNKEYALTPKVFLIGRSQGLPLVEKVTSTKAIEQQQIAASMQILFRRAPVVGAKRYSRFSSNGGSRFRVM